ncbi:hypothetical protein ACS0TY_018543 [Phlomoides rotata]
MYHVVIFVKQRLYNLELSTTKKGSSFGMIMRKRLSDITNSLPQPKSSEKLPPDNVSANDYIDHLLKCRKNGLDEAYSRQKKMQLQNWALAQTNSQIIEELNMGKD